MHRNGKFIIKWTESIGPLHHLLQKNEPDPRMGDVEICVRHLGFSDGHIEYRGDLKAFLDLTSLTYNEKFDDDDFRSEVLVRLQSMNDAINAGIEVFGEGSFCKKWIGNRYERRFNRAIFDVLVGSLVDRNFREWALANRGLVTESYKNICGTNQAFLRSVETTTKTAEATRTRFDTWYSAVRQISGFEIAMPRIS